MKAKHTYHICIAGEETDNIAEMIYCLLLRYASRMLELHVEGSAIEFKTIEVIR